MDRSARATLSSNNTWIQVSRPHKIYHSNDKDPPSRKRCDFSATSFMIIAQLYLRVDVLGDYAIAFNKFIECVLNQIM